MPRLTIPKTDGQFRTRSLNMKTTPELRQQLEAAAAASGRTMTQEVEYRVQRSFDQEALVRELAKVLKDT